MTMNATKNVEDVIAQWDVVLLAGSVIDPDILAPMARRLLDAVIELRTDIVNEEIDDLVVGKWGVPMSSEEALKAVYEIDERLVKILVD